MNLLAEMLRLRLKNDISDINNVTRGIIRIVTSWFKKNKHFDCSRIFKTTMINNQPNQMINNIVVKSLLYQENYRCNILLSSHLNINLVFVYLLYVYVMNWQQMFNRPEIKMCCSSRYHNIFYHY